MHTDMYTARAVARNIAKCIHYTLAHHGCLSLRRLDVCPVSQSSHQLVPASGAVAAGAAAAAVFAAVFAAAAAVAEGATAAVVEEDGLVLWGAGVGTLNQLPDPRLSLLCCA